MNYNTAIEVGDSLVFLPPSVLQRLTEIKAKSPYVFMISNPSSLIKSYCGVQEFTAPEKTVYLPLWLFNYLKLNSGGNILVQDYPFESISVGTFLKIRPH